MCKVAIHGDPVAVQGALQRLDHRDGSIRAAALRTMSWVAEVGDAAAITKALALYLRLLLLSYEFVGELVNSSCLRPKVAWMMECRTFVLLLLRRWQS